MKNTILIVDDAPVYQEALRAVVERLGYPSIVCSDGEEGILRLNETADHILAVFLDIYMPGIDGISTLGHIRRRWPEIPVFIISGSEDKNDEEVVRQLGACGYFKKPGSKDALFAYIQEVLEKQAGLPPAQIA